MPAPALVTGTLAALGTKGVSEAIALGGVVVGTGAVLATVQESIVDISDITFNASASDALFVGDLVHLQATCRVSFGDVWSGGKVRVGLYEAIGNAAPIMIAMAGADQETSPQAVQFDADIVGKLHEREVSYFVGVEVSGEDDVAGTLIDRAVTRVRSSITIKLIFRRPYEISVVKSTPEEKVHGQQDNFQAAATNRGQFDVRVALTWETTNQAPQPRTGLIIESGTTTPTSLDTFSVLGEHSLAVHREMPVQVYTTDLFVLYAFMNIRYPALAVPVREIWLDRPVPFQLVPQYSTVCKVPQGTELGAVLADPEAFFALDRPGEADQQFAISLKGADGQTTAFTATVRDTAGNAVTVASDARGTALVNGAFAGDLAFFVAEPKSPFHDRVSGWFLFDDAESLIGGYTFPVSTGPTITGAVVSPELGPIERATVVLRTSSGAEVDRIQTLAGGRFEIPTSRGVFSSGQPFLDIVLVPSLRVHWAKSRLRVPLSLKSLDRGEPVIVTANLARAERPGPVRVSGTLGMRNEPAGSLSVPIGGANVTLLAPSGQVAAKTISGAKGAWSLEVPPGSYFLSVALAGGRRDADALQPIDIRADRSDVDLVFRIPAPVIDYSAPDRLRVLLPAHLRCTHLALVAGDRVVSTLDVDESGLVDVAREVLLERGVTSLAPVADGVVGRRARLAESFPSRSPQSGQPFGELASFTTGARSGVVTLAPPDAVGS